jgi:stress response protein SCP2
MSEDLNEKMVTDAILILRSVGFLEKKIFQKMGEIDEATTNNYIEDFPLLTSQLQSLLKKIHQEDVNMSAFMLKYKKKVQDEKKGILYCGQGG